MWEYESVPVPMGKEMEVANQYGKDDWELVTMKGPVGMAPSAALQHQATPGWLLIFKRPYDQNRLKRNGKLLDASGIPQTD